MSLNEPAEMVLFEARVTGDASAAIMNQEARGQQALCRSEVLPRECSYCTREQLEQLGIMFGKDVDDLFIEATLPPGWSKQPTEHSMWSQLVDEQGRERARIFYKAAFYDRKAHISLSRRFSVRVEPICGYEHHNYRAYPWHCVVYDCGKPIWEAEQRVEQEPEYRHGDPEEKRLAWLDWHDRKGGLSTLGEEWLDEHYRNWRSPLAHWDD
jgi:hypothetical protein